MSELQLAKAEVVINGETIPVQFNPVSLQVEITNSINQQGEAGGTNQVSTQSSAKMGLELLFDTSAVGEDVRSRTRPLRAAVRAPQDAESSGGGSSSSGDAGAAFVPPLVTFQWGTFTFAGIAESYRETLDFFSADGVPLRAQVAISLKEQAGEFTALERANPNGAASTSAFEVPSELAGGVGGAAGVALAGGDLRAARAIAGANGEASLRFSAGASLSVQAGVQLREAVSFAGGSAGAGFGAGAGLSAGVGLGIGGGVGLDVGIGAGAAAGFGASAGIGAGAGAGLTIGAGAGAGAAAGAGAGLTIGTGASSPSRSSAPALRFDARRLAKAPPARQLATDAGAGFGIDGRALPAGSAGLRSDVGQGRPLSSRLKFDL
ncbi:hypothetical protein [Piscinibacter sakaiensis]|uniref:CIS tube protein n=1 Tax=Piscinibacter sakaiensis TaxID=1547922 RepID=UPI003AAC294E